MSIMILNRFALIVFTRLVLLAISLAALAYGITRPFLPFTLIALAVFSGWLFHGLMKFVNRTNDELAAFFTGLHHMDVTRSFDRSSLERNFNNLRGAFTKVSDQVKDLRKEKEQQALLNQCVIDRIETGIIVFDLHGQVHFHNRSSAVIAGQETLSRLDLVKLGAHPLLQLADTLTPGRPRVVSIKRNGRELPVSVQLKKIIVGQEQMNVLTMQMIKTELDQKEVESWQKLIRVLTHEMMNNITPVVTLSKNIEKCLGKIQPPESHPDFPQAEVDDAMASARMIEERSQSLMHFVNRYRSLTLMPEPDPVRVRVKTFLEHQLGVFRTQFREMGISVKLEVSPEDLEVMMDEKLMSQAITNLLKNAVEALGKAGDPAITVNAFAEGGKPLIRISDNGEGIQPDNLDAVFIPFFSTKQQGSGVGLSLCRQIMGLHQGAIEVESVPSQGATFTLVF
jgi:two-component system, NtrC family, nitrogen regulation sensor histidine kinase NtrY